MHSLGDENNVGNAKFSKFNVIITIIDSLLFMVPDELITVSVIVLTEIFDFLATQTVMKFCKPCFQNYF